MLKGAAARLTGVSDSPRLDAELLLRRVLNKSASWLRTWPEHELNPEQVQAFEAQLARRAAGEPMAYILGEREFWTLRLKVDSHTLIPRPETELLVELALARIPDDAAQALADLGTGTGAIALALARERPLCTMTAVDFSAGALAVARDNAEANRVPGVEFLQGSWYEPLAGRRFSLIASNPPYIDPADPHLSQGDLRFEPRSALVAEEEGLKDLRAIIGQAPEHLHPGGWLLVEHGWQQSEAVCALFRDAGFVDVEAHKDFGGQFRVVSGLKQK
ncbi:MAG: peptide chain release factor N(5)-glutamine methyltransferase [Gammaproteobacteria bacterium]|nr:peptide chain release factor N(5)-glutamine methyltransferase [Gammaproteobacteria bacterium]